MYKLLQKYGKQILAVITVVLMISWAVPNSRKQFGDSNVVIGKLGDEKLYQLDARQARGEWSILKSIPAKGMRVPLTAFLGPAAAQQIGEHPEMFMLLKKEAERLGVGVTKDDVESFITNYIGDLSEIDDEDRVAQIRQAVQSMLLVHVGYQRAASVIKVSDPLKRHVLAQQAQSIQLNLIEFNAKDFADKTPAPTTQATQDQFNKYADIPASGIDSKNPFGFGYRYPNRVKLQYIGISRAEVQKNIEAGKTPYEWEVAARKYYQQHQSEFPSTQPAPANSSFSLAQTTQPTTQPFDDAKDAAKRSVITPEVNKKIEAIQNRISSALGTDWMAWQGATPSGATRPAMLPASTMGVAYDSFEYLEKLATTVQKEFGVRPTIANIADRFQTASDLKTLPGIGAANLEMISFPDYATTHATAFVAAGQKQSDTLDLFEPSPALRDTLDSVYMFRLTDASAAHRPESMNEVAAAVRADTLAVAQYEQAKAAANALIAAAAKASLESASGDRRVVKTGFFQLNPEMEIPGYSLPADLRNHFLPQAFALLSNPATQPSGKHIALIELPHAGKVTVAELADVKANSEQNPALMASYMARQMTNRFEQDFLIRWYNYDNIVARLKYQSLEKKSES